MSSSRRVLWAYLGAACALSAGAVASGVSGSDVARARVSDERASSLGYVARPAVATAVTPRAEPVTLLAPVDSGKQKKSARGDRFVAVSATGSNDVPEAALRAYKNAEQSLEVSRPGCQLPWTLLAAIGRVESDHGRYGGSQLGSDGVSRPAILGVQLNGHGPVAAIHDTDNGRLDGDRVWDRAVGQMQFIPGTWAMVAADGDANGSESPNDIDDAALAAGKYLCYGGFSVADTSGMARAIFSYNHSDYYVALVMAFKRGYETGVFVIPSPPPPPGAGDGLRDPEPAKVKPGGDSQPDRDGSRDGQPGDKDGGDKTGGKSGGSGGKTPPPPKPTPTPTPTPTPSPTLDLTFDTGAFEACGGGFCLGSRQLGFGPADQLARKAAHDYDQDGAVEANAEELSGLVGQSLRLGFVSVDDVAVVYVIRDDDYRFADGSFA